MTITRIVCSLAAAALLAAPAIHADQHGQKTRIYNTVKQKLMDGESVVGGTIYTDDPSIYCAMAHSGFDFLWIEMQHSPLMYNEVARMIWACKDAPAIPFIRVPDATEGDLQKATDIGALGIVVPMVDTVEETERAVLYSKFPPLGRRSRGGGQYAALWGRDYRETANDNIMLVIMLETPAGIANADKIAAVPGVDVVFAASGDIGSFTGYERSDPRYKALIQKIHDDVLSAGKILGGPYSWNGRHGYRFFQGPSESSLIKSGAAAALGDVSAGAKIEDAATGDEPQ